MVVSAVDEDVSVFLEKQRGEMDRDDHVLALEFEDSLGAAPDQLSPNGLRSEKIHSRADENLLILETERVACDWPPKELDTSPILLVKENMQDSVVTQAKNSNGATIFPKSETANSPVESASPRKKSNPLAVSSHKANRIPSSSDGRKATLRSATQTGRTSSLAKTKSFHHSATTLKGTKRVAAQARSVTSARLASIGSKSSSRSATPAPEPSNQAMTSSASAKDRFSSGRKTEPVVSHRTSTFLKTKPSKPLVLHTSSHDTPQSPNTLLMPKRVTIASTRRPSAPNTISLNAKLRQKACLPSREGASNGTHHTSESMVLTRNRSRISTTGRDEVNPVLMGSKTVERVVNMRKLAPPKQDEYSSEDYTQKNPRETSGFGRSLSKKSLDMAIRHMDIRRSIPDSIRLTPRP